MNLWGSTWTKFPDGSWAVGVLTLQPLSKGRWQCQCGAVHGLPGRTMGEALQNLLGAPTEVLGHTYYPYRGSYLPEHYQLPILHSHGNGHEWSATDVDPEDHPPGYSASYFSTPEGALASYLDAWYQHYAEAAMRALAGAKTWRKLGGK